MDSLDDELIELWRVFEKHNLRYIMVEGFASILNGYNRLTADIDIWIKDTKENRQALHTSLQEIGLDTIPDLQNMDFVPGWSSITLPSGFGLDVMTALKGFEQKAFDDCHEASGKAEIDGVTVHFFHINQLIDSKKAVNRLKDQLDIQELEKLRDKNSKE